jgi:hypothetical protein
MVRHSNCWRAPSRVSPQGLNGEGLRGNRGRAKDVLDLVDALGEGLRIERLDRDLLVPPPAGPRRHRTMVPSRTYGERWPEPVTFTASRAGRTSGWG